MQASTAADLERAFAAAVSQRAAAMIVPPLPLYADESQRIATLEKQFRLPCAAQMREFPDAGGLVSYGADLADGSDAHARFGPLTQGKNR